MHRVFSTLSTRFSISHHPPRGEHLDDRLGVLKLRLPLSERLGCGENLLPAVKGSNLCGLVLTFRLKELVEVFSPHEKRPRR